jgi:tetratricopeptide (TPR) repeat protein
MKSKKPDKVRIQERTPITGRRLWVYRLSAIILMPLLFFLMVEACLRIIGYGYPTTMTINCKVADNVCFRDNIKFAYQFFPPTLARMAESFVFPSEKTERTYRIFVLGESAAAGTPDDAFCFGRILRVLLSQQYPQVNFEVITAAMPAINSHAILKIAKDGSNRQPDLFVVYMGNNEVVGPYGAGTVFSPLLSNLSLIRLGISFKATRIGQLINNLLDSIGAGNNLQVWRGLEMFIGKQVRENDPRMEIVNRHFKKNIEDIRKIAVDKNIKIIFCSVGSNLKDSPPFASLHRKNLTQAEQKIWDNLYQQGITFETEEKYAEAIEQYLKADQIDSEYADLQFRLGRCFSALLDYDKSKDRYIKARQLDTLRFRADNSINEIIRSSTKDRAKQGVYFLDTADTFEQNSPNRITGQELFYEHVHLNFDGNYLLAKTIFEQVIQIMPERILKFRAGTSELPTVQDCQRYLAYTDREKYEIARMVLNVFFKKAPFTNQLYHNQQIKQLELHVQTLKDSISGAVNKSIESKYVWALEQNPTDWQLHRKYGIFLEEMKDLNAAMKQYNLVLKYMPDNYEAYAKIGLLLGQQGDLNGDIKNNLESIRINPFYAYAYFNLGVAYHKKNMLDDSVKYYYKAIQFQPTFVEPYIDLGVALYQQGKIDQAIQLYQNGLKRLPDNWDLHYNLGIIFNTQGRTNEAVQQFLTAIKINPDDARARQLLDSIENKR